MSHLPVDNARTKESLGAAAGSALVWRATQQAGIRLISLLRFLILARILAPREFGLLAIAAVAIDLLMSLTDFGMVPALVQANDLKRRQYDAAWTLNLFRAAGISAVAVAMAPILADLFKQPESAAIIRVLALRPILDAAASIRIADLIRDLRFRPITLIRLSQYVVDAVVAIALASTFGVWGLVIGSLCGTAVSSAASYVVAPYTPHLAINAHAAAPLLRFGRWIFVAGVLAISGDALLRVVVSRQLGATDLGIYYVAAKLALLPSDVVSELVASVTFPVQALLQRDRVRAARVFRTTLRTSVAVVAMLYSVLLVLASSVVDEVLGSRWTGAAPVIRVLALAGLIVVVWDPVTATLRGFGRPQWVAALYAVKLPVIAGLVWVLAARFGVVGAAFAWLAGEATVQTTAAGFASRILPRPFSGLARPLAISALAAMAAATAAGLIDGVTSGLLGLSFAAIGGLSLGVIALALLDHRFRVGLRTDAMKAFPGITAKVRGVLHWFIHSRELP